mmetsp:Transcript_17797/g.30166  ORF Transcript_17797/g.30166 Transcript_17797/m.30166 type:complete len:87 (+) Transcript_17797:626-886(+)
MQQQFVKLSNKIASQKMRVKLASINLLDSPEKIEQMRIEGGLPNLRLYRGGNHFEEFGREDFADLNDFTLDQMAQFLKGNKVEAPS